MTSPADPSSPPPGLWGQIKDFANNMDSRAWRALAITLARIVSATGGVVAPDWMLSQASVTSSATISASLSAFP